MARAVPVTSLARPGRPCLDALVAALAEVRGGDPLAPATVLVPGALAGLHVRRALGRLGGTAAVEVIPTGRLADRLAGPVLAAAGTQPLPPGGWEEAVRVALAEDPGPFRAVAHHPATVARVASALRRLRPATAPEREALAAASGGPRSRHLVRLLGAVEEGSGHHHDRLAVVVAAGAALGSGADPGPVVAFCPPGTDPAEVDLLVALAATGRLRVVVSVTGDPSADEPVRGLVGRLDGPGGGAVGPGEPPPVPAHLVLAPDAEAEARLVVQDVVAALEAGVPGHAIGVLALGGAAGGLGRLSDLLDAAGVPWSGPTGRTLAATPAGRVLLALLGLGAEGWSHAGVLAALAAAPLRRSPSRPGPLPLGRWAALARRANVVRGPDQWHERPLAAAETARRSGHSVAAAELVDLAGFASELRTLLTPPAEATWTALAGWAVTVLDHLLDPSANAGWPDAEVAAFAAVRSATAAVAHLDLGGAARVAPAPADLLAALDARLTAVAAPRRGRVGHGVLLATDPVDLVGATPQLVLLAGVVEGAAPARRAADPLVTDAELQLVGGAPDRARRRAGSSAAVLVAVAAADRTVAFAHRADAQATRRPSRWFLGWAADRAGASAPLGADDVEHLDVPWLTVVPSFAATTCGPVAGSAQELRVAGLAAAARSGTPADELATSAIVLGHPALRRSMVAALARRSHRFTEWDGLVAPGLALDEEVSATALEDWAACPQRYLLRRVLGVDATEAPVDPLDVDARDRGTLAHEVLAAAVRRGLGRPATAPWDDDDRTLLRADLRRRVDDRRRQGRMGRGVLAELRVDELQAGLLAALDLDDADRAEEGWVPLDVEHAFGERHGRPVAVALPSGRTLRFSGRADRVDATAERVRVVDYKTGRAKAYLDAAAGGAAAARHLQLGVYEAAARGLRPGAAVTSGWWLLDVVGKDGQPLPVQPNHLEPDGFSAALDAIASGVETGAFPADPGEDGYRGPETCRFCPYDRVCRVDRVRALRRKADDPALEPWRSLRAIGQAVAADEGRG